MRPSALLAVSAVLLAAGLLTTPAAAAAPAESTSDSAKLAAGTEELPAVDGRRSHRVGRGEQVPALLGVTNIGDAPVDGLVVHVRILDDLAYTKTYENCWYAFWTNQSSAWCEFNAELAPGESLAALGLGIATIPNAKPEDISPIIHRWYSKAEIDGRGGIQQVADGSAYPPGKAVRGTGAPLTLSTPSVPLVGLEPPNPLGFVDVVLVLPATPTPTATPTATAPPTATPTAPPTVTPSATPTGTPTDVPSASPGVPGEDDGQGGGLPVTGTQTATVAGVGGGLLLLGGAAYLIARRRRTTFVA